MRHIFGFRAAPGNPGLQPTSRSRQELSKNHTHSSKIVGPDYLTNRFDDVRRTRQNETKRQVL